MVGLPSINITFQNTAAASVSQGSTGIAAIVLKDASVLSGVLEVDMATYSDIPVTLSAANKVFLNDVFSGSPKQVKAVIIADDAANYTEALTYLETIKFDIMTIPGILDADVAAISTWAKGVYDNNGKKILAVLPKSVSDHEAVINFVTDDIVAGEDIFTSNDYLARVTGLIAGLPLTVAPTYRVLSEVNDVPHLTKSQADTLVDAGKLILYHDGEKVKIARGVTSLTTVTSKPVEYKKIKIMRILNLIYADVKKTIEDNYIGSIQNSYTNKLLLISAINAYFEVLENGNILDVGKNKCEIDLAAQKTYLISQGVDTSVLTEQQIKEYNTNDKVFLTATVVPLDAIEDITLAINI